MRALITLCLALGLLLGWLALGEELVEYTFSLLQVTEFVLVVLFATTAVMFYPYTRANWLLIQVVGWIGSIGGLVMASSFLFILLM
jgi:hypothetical protein